MFGMQQSALDSRTADRAEQRCRALAHDIDEGFRKHHLELLCLCELGEHEIGLQGRKNLGCRSQNGLLNLLVHMASEDLDGGASESAVQVELLSGQYPTYAALKRREPKLAVEAILFHCGLGRR